MQSLTALFTNLSKCFTVISFSKSTSAMTRNGFIPRNMLVWRKHKEHVKYIDIPRTNTKSTAMQNNNIFNKLYYTVFTHLDVHSESKWNNKINLRKTICSMGLTTNLRSTEWYTQFLGYLHSVSRYAKSFCLQICEVERWVAIFNMAAKGESGTICASPSTRVCAYCSSGGWRVHKS